MNTGKELMIVATPTENHITQAIANGSAFAGHLAEFIATKKLFSNIQGKKYIHVEGWQLVLESLGFMFTVDEAKQLDEDTWMVRATAHNGTQSLSAYALCSRRERSKKSFDDYAILSMAQTRAVAKIGRNNFAYILKTAGYEGTPAEEMDFQQRKHAVVDAEEDPVEDEAVTESPKDQQKYYQQEWQSEGSTLYAFKTNGLNATLDKKGSAERREALANIIWHYTRCGTSTEAGKIIRQFMDDAMPGRKFDGLSNEDQRRLIQFLEPKNWDFENHRFIAPF